MFFWLTASLLVGFVLWMLARPLREPTRRASDVADGEVAVYRDQLAEIDRDRQGGILDANEAAAARIEVSRRLIVAAGEAGERPTAVDRASASRQFGWPFLLAGVCIPALALAIYAPIGSWQLASAPSTGSAVGQGQAGIAQLVGQVEARLREQPEDGHGWDVVAPVYLKLERFEEAAQAFRRAMRLLGENEKRLQGFAEASVLARNGVVTEEAKHAYEKILIAHPGLPEPRFWLAMAKEQDGRLDEALADYRRLLAQAPAGAAWRSPVEARLRIVELQLTAQTAAQVRGPSAEDIAAAAQLSAAERNQMITQMVDGLAARLEANGKDLDGWRRLMRSYRMLGDEAKATAALIRARKALDGDSAALASLNEFARALGLGS